MSLLFENCLLACDIDGTLLENNIINEENITEIKRFCQNGGVFSVSTGRSPAALSCLEKISKNVSYCIVYNGGMLYNYSTGQTVYQNVLSQKDKHFTKEVLKSVKTVGAEIHCGADTYVLRDSKEVKDHIEYSSLKAEYVSFEDIFYKDWHKAMLMIDDDPSAYNKLKILSASYPTSSFMDTSAYIYGKQRHYFEQMPIDVSKDKGVLRLAEMLGIKKGGIFSIGDYYNDLSMLSVADVSAVTADAPDDMKMQVNFVGKACKDGAVADFIKYLFIMKGCK